jgi:UDP-N-acetyl-D-galactosamine dehydrogenase
MGKYVAENLVKAIIKADKPVKNAKVAILGLTFKENCPDTRNTRVIDIYRELREYDISPIIVDPIADSGEAMLEYGVKLSRLCDLKDLDALVLAVAHDEFKALDSATLGGFFRALDLNRILFDLKGVLSREECESAGYLYWRL